MILLVGGDSEIAIATARALRASLQVVGATTRRAASASAERPFLDLAGPLHDWQPPEGTRAACVLAAIARLAACDADPAGSAHINLEQTVALIDRLTSRGVYVLFLSTNQVFDGETPCVPAEAATCPVSEYGRQKAKTEGALRDRMAGGAPIAILRLSKVVSPDMALIRQWRHTLSQGRSIAAFADMPMAPVPVDTVAKAISALLRDKVPGLFQLAGPRDVSYLQLGRHLAEWFGADPCLVEPASALACGQPTGSTPRHTTLDSRRLRERYGVVVPDAWEVMAPLFDGTRTTHE